MLLWEYFLNSKSLNFSVESWDTFLIEMRVFLIESINSTRKEDKKGGSCSIGGSFSFDLGGSDSALFGKEAAELLSFSVLKKSFSIWLLSEWIPFK
jgi:hypothetical protein